MKHGRLFSLAALAAASLLLIGAESRAEPITLPTDGLPLNTLVGTPFQVGDKIFTLNSVTPTGSTGSQEPNPAAIKVIPETLSGGTIAAGFGLAGLSVNAFNSAGSVGNFSDLALVYTVTSLGGPITAVNLSGNGATSGAGSSVSIGERVFDPVTNSTIASGTLVGFSNTTISLNGSFTSIGVEKDIAANAGSDANGFANYSQISQTFTQGVVPEPASMAMMGTGLLGVIGFGLSRGRKLNQTV